MRRRTSGSVVIQGRRHILGPIKSNVAIEWVKGKE